MQIFTQRLILLLTLFSPVQLMDYKLIQANFNMNDIVYKNDVYISMVEKNTYKMTSFGGAAQIFHIYDIITFIGTYVEFDTYDSKLKIQCLFENRKMAQRFVREVKGGIHYHTKFPMFLITPVIGNGDTYDRNNARIEALVKARLIVELRIRFIAVSDEDGSILMIFTARHFNVSPLLRNDRMLMVVQVYDIQREEIIGQTFLFDFLDSATAKLFYKYVKEDLPPVTDNMITVAVPKRISYPYNGTIRNFSLE